MEVSRVMNDIPSLDRQLAGEPMEVWIYQDSVEELMKICEENGLQPGDVLREAFDEWLSRRRILIELFSESMPGSDPAETTVSSIDNLLERIQRDGW
jgi:hypothetical protein